MRCYEYSNNDPTIIKVVLVHIIFRLLLELTFASSTEIRLPIQLHQKIHCLRQYRMLMIATLTLELQTLMSGKLVPID